MSHYNDNILISKYFAYLVVLIVYLRNNYFGSFNIAVNKLATLKGDKAEHVPE